MKVVYSDKKSGKTAQADVAKESESMLIGKKIGDIIEGGVIKLDGYKLQITGLSDNMGAPSRKEIDGTRKARPLLSSGPGLRGGKAGYRSRRLIRGNTISTDTVQVNTVITEYGAMKVEELFKPKEKKEE
jgi:small subunit ribosomal protein S6e